MCVYLTGFSKRHSWVSWAKNERPINFIDLLIELIVGIFLCCLCRPCAASTDLAPTNVVTKINVNHDGRDKDLLGVSNGTGGNF